MTPPPRRDLDQTLVLGAPLGVGLGERRAVGVGGLNIRPPLTFELCGIVMKSQLPGWPRQSFSSVSKSPSTSGCS